MLIAATEVHPEIEDRVLVPEAPSTEARATLEAKIAAFASEEVEIAYRTWRTSMDEIWGEWDALGYYWREVVAPEPVAVEDLRSLRDELRPAEQRARRAMADRIAAELRHRSSKVV